MPSFKALGGRQIYNTAQIAGLGKLPGFDNVYTYIYTYML